MKKIVLMLMAIFILINLSYGVVSAADSQNNSSEIVTVQNTLNESNSSDRNDTYITTVNAPFSSIHGYFVMGSTNIDNLDPNNLLNEGITDLFVLTNKNNPGTTLVPYIQKFSGTGIRVHAWVSSFKDFSGNWFYPDEHPELVNQIVDTITSIATNYNVDGIILDYVRYPGYAFAHPTATQEVTSFIQRIYNNVNSINSQNIAGKPKILLSAAVMADCSENEYYYGQNYEQISNYVDFLVPMIYKGNYGQTTKWIGITTKYIVQHANGKPVVAALQTYLTDDNPIRFPASELISDITAAMDNGSYGYALYRYGLVSPDFHGIPVTGSFTIAEISAAAGDVQSFIEANQKLPSFVTIAGKQINMAQFLSLLINATIKANTGDVNPVDLQNIKAPSHPSEDAKNGSINKSEYISLANTIKSLLDTNNTSPDNINSSLGKISYESLIYTYSKILVYYGSKNTLPNSVSFTLWPQYNVPPTVTSTNPANNDTEAPISNIITIEFSKNIFAGANFAGIYVKNLTTGKTVTIASKTIVDNILTIKQTVNRLNNSSYQVYLPVGAVKDAAGNNLATAYSYQFKTIAGTSDTTPPTVTSTNPANGATGVSTSSKTVSITFSENIQAGANFDGIYIKNLSTGKTVAITSKTITNNILTIIQTYNRLNNNNYQVYIPTAAIKDTTGNNLTTPYTYTFSTGQGSSDTTPPTVTSTNPANGATGVSTSSKTVSITFSENIQAGANFDGIYIKNLSTGKTVAITSKTITNNILTIIQTYNRLNNNNYQVYIPTAAIKDTTGNNLTTPYTYNFTTAGEGTDDTIPPSVNSSNPASGATGVSITSRIITITFSENIQAGANFDGIYVKNLNTGKQTTIATKTISGNTLTIIQTYNRLNNNNYQVYIPTAAIKDTTGNNLTTPYSYQFQTI